ncbi:trypsin-like serine protease [Luteolibacter algae]
MASALVIYGGDNSTNRTDPGSGLPFESVGSLSNLSGDIGGTGIYLGNGYVLTAGHVAPYDRITFDGTTFFTRDASPEIRVAPGVDLKIIHLSSAPPLSGVSIYTGSDESLSPATIVAYGVGRSDDGSSLDTVTWGDTSTVAKRWGTNQIGGSIDDFNYSSYAFDALQTTLGQTAGEAGATVFDSGSGLFQNIAGNWYLTGITSVVTQKSGSGTSTFGTDSPALVLPGAPSSLLQPPGSGDVNLFVRLSSYATAITGLTSVPEPSTALILSLLSAATLRRKRS